MNNLQITPEIKLSELLDSFPELEDKIIEIIPAFEKLKNPILRKTLAKVTTLRQASKVGEVSLAELINKLRLAAGQNEIEVAVENRSSSNKPQWIKDSNIKETYDARNDLENGEHPVGKVSKEILLLNEDEIYLLITPFLPGPLISIVEEKGFEVYSVNKSDDEVLTYIRRKV